MSKFDLILAAIKKMDDSEIVRIWNEYCYSDGRYDDEIMDSYSFEEYAKNADPMQLMNRMYFGHDENDQNSSANPNRNYFCFNGYANIISFDYIYNSYSDEFYNIYIDEMINYIIENEESFDNDEIAEILEGKKWILKKSII